MNNELFPWLENDDINDPEGTIEDPDGILTFNDRCTIDQEEAEDDEIYDDEDEEPALSTDTTAEYILSRIFDGDYDEYELELEGEVED